MPSLKVRLVGDLHEAAAATITWPEQFGVYALASEHAKERYGLEVQTQ